MINKIFWLLAILVMLVLLFSTIYNIIDRIQTDKSFRESNKKYLELLNKEIEKLEREDK